MSISQFVNINEGRTARLKCYTLNVPNVTVSIIKFSYLSIEPTKRVKILYTEKFSIQQIAFDPKYKLSPSEHAAIS